jgi:hypothetical protein
MIPTQLGRYRIIQKLATGGMGQVYLARQEGPAGFSKSAVVKQILSHLAGDPRFVEMFLAEARLAAILSHPNIVQIFELGEADGGWFIAMEYLHGRSLRDVRQQAEKRAERIPSIQAARIMAQALEGLHCAHTARGDGGLPLNIVHRDVSPENVFVCFNGTVKVLDFGIAKAADRNTTTRAGEVKGKYAYMAPEHLAGQPVDARSDVYGAGIVLYEAVCGERPFDGPSDAATIHKIITTEAPNLAQRAPEVPEVLSEIVMKALAKNPDDRFRSAEEFRAALEAFIASTGEASNNAATARYLKHLFGEAAVEATNGVVPALATDLTHIRAAAPVPAPLQLNDAIEKFGVEQTYEPVRLSPPAPAPVLELEQPAPAPAVAATPKRSRGPLIAVAIGLALCAAVAVALIRPRGATVAKGGNLSIKSDPAGATVHIGAEQRGITPWFGKNVWSGDVAYELTAQGYESAGGTFRGGEETKVVVKLTKKTGR